MGGATSDALLDGLGELGQGAGAGFRRVS